MGMKPELLQIPDIQGEEEMKIAYSSRDGSILQFHANQNSTTNLFHPGSSRVAHTRNNPCHNASFTTRTERDLLMQQAITPGQIPEFRKIEQSETAKDFIEGFEKFTQEI